MVTLDMGFGKRFYVSGRNISSGEEFSVDILAETIDSGVLIRVGGLSRKCEIGLTNTQAFTARWKGLG